MSRFVQLVCIEWENIRLKIIIEIWASLRQKRKLIRQDILNIRQRYAECKIRQDKGVFRCRAMYAELHRTATPFGDLKRCYLFGFVLNKVFQVKRFLRSIANFEYYRMYSLLAVASVAFDYHPTHFIGTPKPIDESVIKEKRSYLCGNQVVKF